MPLFQLPKPTTTEVFCWVCEDTFFPTNAGKRRDAINHCRDCKGAKKEPVRYQCTFCSKTFDRKEKLDKHPHMVMSKSPGKFVTYYAKTEENDPLLIAHHKKILRHESVPICIEQRWTIPGEQSFLGSLKRDKKGKRKMANFLILIINLILINDFI